MGARGDGELGGRLADQDGDGMFELGALDSEVDQLRLRGVELGLGLRHVAIGGDAAGEAVAREREKLLVGLDGCVEQVDVAIESVQLEVVLGQFGLKEQAGVLQHARRWLGRCWRWR